MMVAKQPRHGGKAAMILNVTRASLGRHPDFDFAVGKTLPG
jgi:hypothetical protein